MSSRSQTLFIVRQGKLRFVIVNGAPCISLRGNFANGDWTISKQNALAWAFTFHGTFPGLSETMNVFVLINVERFRGGNSSLPKHNLMLTLNFMWVDQFLWSQGNLMLIFSCSSNSLVISSGPFVGENKKDEYIFGLPYGQHCARHRCI